MKGTKPKTTELHIRVREDQKTWMKQLAAHEKKSLSELIIECLEKRDDEVHMRDYEEHPSHGWQGIRGLYFGSKKGKK